MRNIAVIVRQHKSKELLGREAKELQMFKMRVWEFTDCPHQCTMMYLFVVNSRELQVVISQGG